MNFTQSFKLAIKSLMTSKMRAFLTMLGIIIGVAAVIVIISLGNGLKGMVEQQVEKIGVNQMYVYNWGRGDGTTLNLDPNEMFDLAAEYPDLITGVSPWVSGPQGIRVNGTEYKKTGIMGVSESMYRPETHTTLDGDTLAQGRYLQYVDMLRRQKVCVVGAYVADKALGGDALNKTILIGGVPYTVVGVLEKTTDIAMEGGSDDNVFIPYENAMEMTGSRDVGLYQITCTSRDTAAQAKEIVSQKMMELYQDSDAFYIQTMAEQVAEINAMMGVAMAVLVAIAGISLLVGGIGIMNIMLVSVTERTREIGIRKSLGAKRRDIRRQFVIEAGTTSAIGGVLGIVFGFAVSALVGSIFGNMLTQSMGVPGLTFNAIPTPMAILVSFGVSVGIGILFGYLPANKAAQLNPIDALRYD